MQPLKLVNTTAQLHPLELQIHEFPRFDIGNTSYSKCVVKLVLVAKEVLVGRTERSSSQKQKTKRSHFSLSSVCHAGFTTTEQL